MPRTSPPPDDTAPAQPPATVRISAPLLNEFIYPRPDGDDIHITPAGVDLPADLADTVTQAAARSGVTLLTLPTGKD